MQIISIWLIKKERETTSVVKFLTEAVVLVHNVKFLTQVGVLAYNVRLLSPSLSLSLWEIKNISLLPKK